MSYDDKQKLFEDIHSFPQKKLAEVLAFLFTQKLIFQHPLQVIEIVSKYERTNIQGSVGNPSVSQQEVPFLLLSLVKLSQVRFPL